MGRRIRWLGVILLLCFALVVVQLVNIQFRRANALSNDPYNPAVASKKFDNARGTISASDGTVLARSVKINSSRSTYNYEREYPEATAKLYSGITGYDSIFYGTSGIEYEYNQFLETHSQPAQNFSQLLFNKPPSETDNVTLTVDPVLQQAASAALARVPGVDQDGAVVVLNPTTGAVLAMVSYPNFDPNGVSSPDVTSEEQAHFEDSVPDHEGFDPILPLATFKPFAPGSTFKVVTSTAVYNLKPSLINYSFPSAVSLKFSDSTLVLNNDGLTACGGTMVAMLPASCDPGYGALGIQIGVPTLTQQADLFGYNKVPGIDLPNVAASPFPGTPQPLPDNSQALLAYSAIGQYDVAATALQNAMVAAGIANGGVIMTPHLLLQVRDEQGNVVDTYTPKPEYQAASKSAAASVNTLMQSVVTEGTAAQDGFPASWQVAAKTGTAQAPEIVNGVKVEKTDDWMIAFTSAKSTPQLAIAVVVPYQEQDLTGALVAGPIVKAVIQAYATENGGNL